MMRGYGVQYSFDVGHLVDNVSPNSLSDTIIIVDYRDGPIFMDDLQKVMNTECDMIIRGENLPLPTETQAKYIHFIGSDGTNDDVIRVLENLRWPKNTNSQKSILIIEDNADIREMYSISFKSKWYTVYEAADGLIGIARAVEVKPDLIILDIMMPQMDGFEVLYTLKNNTNIRPRIIVNSNLEWVNEENKVRNLGADFFMRKSQFTPLEVISFIEKNIFTQAPTPPTE